MNSKLSASTGSAATYLFTHLLFIEFAQCAAQTYIRWTHKKQRNDTSLCWNCYRFRRLVCLVDDAAVRKPGDNKRREEHEHILDCRVDCQSFLVHVWQTAILLRTARRDDVRPEQLRTVQSDAQCPYTAHAQWRHLRREIPSTDFLQTKQSA